ncbi:Protein kinase of the Mitotic Exit Network [Umbelopsis sp. WA50703]
MVASLDMRRRSALNYIPATEISYTKSIGEDYHKNSTKSKYIHSKHHSDLFYAMDPMSLDVQRHRHKSRSEIITEQKTRALHDQQDRSQYRHVKDILFDMQGQPDQYTSAETSTQPPKKDHIFPSNIIQRANELTDAAQSFLKMGEIDEDEIATPSAAKSPSDSGYGTNERRRLSKQPSIPASFMSIANGGSNNTTAANALNTFSSSISNHNQTHGRETKHTSSVSSKHGILNNLPFPKKTSTRQKIPFHTRYQEWSEQNKEKFDSSRIQNTDDFPFDYDASPTALYYDILSSSHKQYDDVEQLGNMQPPNPFPSMSSPMPTLKDPIKAVDIFKGGSVGKTKDKRQSITYSMKTSDIKRTVDISKERLSLFDDGGELLAQYQLGNCIGKGQYGSVYKALNLGTGQMVAVKRIALENANAKEIDELMKEVDLLKSLTHPNVVQYEGFSFSENHLNIILEYVENGSLRNTLQAFGAFPERLVASYCVRILQGLSYLHQNEVVHCDLKAANILTTKGGNVKLTDFGVSLNLKMNSVEDGVVAGTPNWMAPEIIELKGACFESDIWSLGCTIIELCTGKPPYADLIAMATLFRIVEDDCPPLPDNISEELQDFLRRCFRKVAADRPSPEQLLNHKWIHKNVFSLSTELTTDMNQNPRHSHMKRHTTAPDVLLPMDRSIPSATSVSPPFAYRQNNYSEGNLPASIPVERRSLDLQARQGDVALNSQPPTTRSVGFLMSKGTGGVTSRLFSRASKRFSREIEVADLHRFVKTSFSKSVVCKACLQMIKKHALFCQDCSLVCHERCKQDVPPCSIYVVTRPSLDESSNRDLSPNMDDETDSKPPVNGRPRPFSEPPKPTRRRKSAATILEEAINVDSLIAQSATSPPAPSKSISANLRQRTRKLSKAISSVSTTNLHQHFAELGRAGRNRDNHAFSLGDGESVYSPNSINASSNDLRLYSSSDVSHENVPGARIRRHDKDECIIS